MVSEVVNNKNVFLPLSPEQDHGSIEYKLKITDICEQRFQKLLTQMKFRLEEKNNNKFINKCIYYLGVSDDGTIDGINKSQYNESLNYLKKMAYELKCVFTILFERDIEGTELKYGKIMIEKKENNIYIDCSNLDNFSVPVISNFPNIYEFDNIDHDLNKYIDFFNHKITVGDGEFIIKLGVDDKGKPFGLDNEKYNASLHNLELLSHKINCEATELIDTFINDDLDKKCGEILIRRRKDETSHPIELRIVTAGNVDAGKSTLVSVLTKGQLDDGRGSARKHVFNHKHESSSGRTSSISQKILGFNAKGKIVNYDDNRSYGDSTISSKSSKIITLYDLAGHEKYLKTTIHGLYCSCPDYAIVIVSANNGIQKMTLEHFNIIRTCKIPIIFVVTRIDSCPLDVYKGTIKNIKRLIATLNNKKEKSKKVILYEINNKKEAYISMKNISSTFVPIISVSNTTGKNIDLLRYILNVLPRRTNWKQFQNDNTEYHIDGIYTVQGVGTVVSGLIKKGFIKVNDTLQLGPNKTNNFTNVMVKSIHHHCYPQNIVYAGTNATLALKKVKKEDIEKNMKLLDSKTNCVSVREFKAEIIIKHHSTTITIGYEPIIYVDNIKECAKIIDIDIIRNHNIDSEESDTNMTNKHIETTDKKYLRIGDKAIIHLRLKYRNIYVSNNSDIGLIEGKLKGNGKIINIIN